MARRGEPFAGVDQLAVIFKATDLAIHNIAFFAPEHHTFERSAMADYVHQIAAAEEAKLLAFTARHQ